MFDTLKKSISAAAVAALMVVGMASSASAAIVNIDPGDSNVLTTDTVYRTQSEEQIGGAAFSDQYFFSLPDIGGNGTSSVFYSYDVTFPVPEGAAAGIGIADLTFELFDSTNSTVLATTTLTDANGFAFVGFENGFNFTGVWPAPIDITLTVSGTALSQGGSYEATVAAVPLPAPLMLFVSALVGLGFLGRRRLSA
jgi:opacity protein-like surface antigen|tara:strand:- start:14 stop:601 length:588 start_codon:yes stop_codon:yes gene_type:complete